ncbi:MAG: hypothetical protein HYX61_02355 [Gammaproteobacteria bacterium]|jgi:hypothetical protein|nr:hypothetical protein [Gammaproteobacteria bacterium]
MWDYIEQAKNAAIKYGAATSYGQGWIKGYLKERIELHFGEAGVEIESIKKTIKSDKKLSKELSATLEEVEAKTGELLTFATADEQLDVFAAIIGKKVGDYASVKDFKEALQASPAIKKMKEFALKLVSPDIYEGLSAVIKKAGDIKKLSKKDQAELVKILKSDDIADNLKDIDLKKSLDGFKKNGMAFCKELKLNADDTQDLETIFDDLVSEHLAGFEKIKKDLEAHLPTVLKKLLEYVHTECPHLAIEDAPKTVIHSKAAPKKAPNSKPAPKKPAPKRKAEKEVEVEDEDEENVIELSDSDEPEEVVKAPVKKKGPGKR